MTLPPPPLEKFTMKHQQDIDFIIKKNKFLHYRDIPKLKYVDIRPRMGLDSGIRDFARSFSCPEARV